MTIIPDFGVDSAAYQILKYLPFTALIRIYLGFLKSQFFADLTVEMQYVNFFFVI